MKSLPSWLADYTKLPPLKELAEKMRACTVWKVRCEEPFALLLVGDLLVAGGENRVQAYDLALLVCRVEWRLGGRDAHQQFAPLQDFIHHTDISKSLPLVFPNFIGIPTFFGPKFVNIQNHFSQQITFANTQRSIMTKFELKLAKFLL